LFEADRQVQHEMPFAASITIQQKSSLPIPAMLGKKPKRSTYLPLAPSLWLLPLANIGAAVCTVDDEERVINAPVCVYVHSIVLCILLYTAGGNTTPVHQFPKEMNRKKHLLFLANKTI
jgi:hypothetical protein